MRIVGCDVHARQQTLAMLNGETGEVEEHGGAGVLRRAAGPGAGVPAQTVAACAGERPQAGRLMTHPGVGPLTGVGGNSPAWPRPYGSGSEKCCPHAPARKSATEHSTPVGAYLPMLAGDAA